MDTAMDTSWSGCPWTLMAPGARRVPSKPGSPSLTRGGVMKRVIAVAFASLLISFPTYAAVWNCVVGLKTGTFGTVAVQADSLQTAQTKALAAAAQNAYGARRGGMHANNAVGAAVSVERAGAVRWRSAKDLSLLCTHNEGPRGEAYCCGLACGGIGKGEVHGAGHVAG